MLGMIRIKWARHYLPRRPMRTALSSILRSKPLLAENDLTTFPPEGPLTIRSLAVASLPLRAARFHLGTPQVCLRSLRLSPAGITTTAGYRGCCTVSRPLSVFLAYLRVLTF